MFNFLHSIAVPNMFNHLTVTLLILLVIIIFNAIKKRFEDDNQRIDD